VEQRCSNNGNIWGCIKRAQFTLEDYLLTHKSCTSSGDMPLPRRVFDWISASHRLRWQDGQIHTTPRDQNVRSTGWYSTAELGLIRSSSLYLVFCNSGMSCNGTVRRHPGVVRTLRDTGLIQCRCQQSVKPNTGSPTRFSRDQSHKTQMRDSTALKLNSVHYGDKKRKFSPPRTSPVPLIDCLRCQDLLKGSYLGDCRLHT